MNKQIPDTTHERFIVRQDETSSSEYMIWDVVKQIPDARGLEVEEARQGAFTRNEKWRQEKSCMM